MLFKQFVDDDLGCGSYLVGCEGAGVAAVVDPGYAIEKYLDEAERRDVRITCVVATISLIAGNPWSTRATPAFPR